MVFSILLSLAEEFFRRLLGVLQPKLLMEGIDFELKLAERELLDKLAVRGDSETLGPLPSRSQKCSVLSSCEFMLASSSAALSSEFWGDVVEYLCFLFKAFGDGVDLKYKNLEISQTVKNDGLLLFLSRVFIIVYNWTNQKAGCAILIGQWAKM